MKKLTAIRHGTQSPLVANLRLALSCVVVNSVLTLSAAPPTINFPPRSQTVILYQQAAFGVIASGTAPLTYQWSKVGVPIAGATNDQIVLLHPRFSDAGRYSVVVSNAEGSVTSAEASLTVSPPKGGDVDCSFISGGSIDGQVLSVAVQPDGKILIGGGFSTVHGAARGGIARLNADGTTEHTFMNGLSGANERVTSVAVQRNGKVLIGGSFSTVNGVSRNGIARLNADGTLDSNFQNELLGGTEVSSVAVQSDGKVLIVGSFATVNGVSRNGIVRHNVDGNLDSGFQNGPSGASYHLTSVAVQSDGKILVGGSFITVNGVTLNGIARLNADGTLDSSFLNGLSGASAVNSVAVQSDGKVLIGGFFRTVNDVSRTNIARLNVDGSLDSSFQSDVSGADYSSVSSVVVQSDGKVLLGGVFSAVNGVSRNGIARLNADGTLDSGFQNGFSGVDGDVSSIVVQSDGKVLLGGGFSTVNGVSSKGIARLNADGTLDSSVQNGLAGANNQVTSVAVQSDGKVVIGGGFSAVNGASRKGIARLNADGTLDNGFKGEVSGAADYSAVSSVMVQSDGKVLVGGSFTTVNGVSRTNIARLNADGSLDGGFQNRPSGADQWVNSVAVQSDGKVLIGGSSYTAIGGSCISIARLNADGGLDNTFQSGLSESRGAVSSVAVQSDGKVLIAGGRFTQIGPDSFIARLEADGTLDRSFEGVISGADWNIWGRVAVAVQSEGKVLIVGSFANVNGVGRDGIARLNGNGSLDSGFQTMLPGYILSFILSSVAVQSDGKVLIGGNRFVARLNGDGTLDSGFQDGLSGANNYVTSVAEQSDGKVLIGGSFTTVNGVPAAGIARLWGSADIPPRIQSINRSGVELNLTWDALPNRTYRVQYKVSLSANTWTDLVADISTTDGIASKTDSTFSNANQRFYRVVLLP